jgi:arsenate reductase
MAEGIFRYLAGDKFEVFSAGINPTRVNPIAIKVMDEVGIDISKQRPKSVSEFSGQKFDYVITVCDNAKQSCPAFPGKYEKIHWNLKDPAGAQGTEEEKLKLFREIRNQIKENVLSFLELPKDKANLKCPLCGYIQEVIIPENSCLHFYECKACRKTFTPRAGSCCVICAYSAKNCPSFSRD